MNAESKRSSDDDERDLRRAVNRRLADMNAKPVFKMSHDEALAEVVRLRSAYAFVVERNIVLTRANHRLRGTAIEKGDAL